MSAFGRREVAAPQRIQRPVDELTALREQFLAGERARRAELASRNGEMSEVATSYESRDPREKKSQTDRDLTTAYLLWLFLGIVSAHRFYLGATRFAVVQALMFVVGMTLLYLADYENTLMVFFGFLLALGWGCWLLADGFIVSRLHKKLERGEKVTEALF